MSHRPTASDNVPATSNAALAFRLGPDTRRGPVATRSVTVCPISDAKRALFVDGVAGSDSAGDGSPLRPFASLAGALRAVAGIGRQDIYIATLETGAGSDQRFC